MTSIIPESSLYPSDLYDRDFVLWCEETIAHLRAQNWDNVNIENLIEEIEGLAKRDKRELASRLNVLITHLLKRLYVQRPEDYRGWEITILEQRSELQLLLEQSPSLKSYFLERFPVAWEYGRKSVRTDYPRTNLPEEWQYSREIEDFLSVPFWLESSAGLDDSDDR